MDVAAALATSDALVAYTAPAAAQQAAETAAAPIQIDAEGWAQLDIESSVMICEDDGQQHSSVMLCEVDEEEDSSVAMTLDGVFLDKKMQHMLNNTEPLPAGHHGISKAAKAAKAAAPTSSSSKTTVKAVHTPQKKNVHTSVHTPQKRDVHTG